MDTAFETPGVLDLSGADTSTFEAIPGARYLSVVWDYEWVATQGQTENNPNAKLPAGVPMLKLQFRLDNDRHADTEFMPPESNEVTKIGKNRTLFGQIVVPTGPNMPADYDPDKLAKMKGTLVNFLTALGYDRKKIESGKFHMEPEDFKGKPLVLVVNRYKFPKNAPYGEGWRNGVTGYKPADSDISTPAESGGIL